MKWMIASDIHGSAYYCQIMLDQMKKEKADKLLLLGDLLYHGPRNDLPKGYDPKKVIALLNAQKEKIVCVQGNCDAEVDQMVLDFPVLIPVVIFNGKRGIVYCCHGHKDIPCLQTNDILLQGHTHIPMCKNEGYMHLNPGSISLPKEKSVHSYMIWQNNTFIWKDLLNGQEYMHYEWSES